MMFKLLKKHIKHQIKANIQLLLNQQKIIYIHRTMILRKSKIKKEHHPLCLNWNQIKKLLLVQDLTNIQQKIIIVAQLDMTYLKQKDFIEYLFNQCI
ncbi:unnamed protein product [Paramecium pentaurelia]|uniref:Uncharacterized protein n=1 Tax=Paramecium pentaurelia TaxID=43138 RepID=A0A8S1YDT8_9CILI|nr:unnamed protein product [Paramecium pentaurelia]